MKGINFKSQKVRMIAAAGLCLFSTVAVITATIAWFTAFRQNEDDSSNMHVISPNGIFDRIDLYQLTATGGIDYGKEKFHFNKTAVAYAYYDNAKGKVEYSTNFTITMDTYSDLDQHSPILMIVTLKEDFAQSPTNPLTVYASCDKNYYFGEKDASGDPKYPIKEWDPETEEGEKNPLSSVVAFYTMGYANLDPITETNYYNVPIAEYDTDCGYDRETFVSFNETTTEYQNFTQRKNLYYGTTEKTVRYLAIVVDYYHYALEYVYNTFIGNKTLENTIYFECDWNMVI